MRGEFIDIAGERLYYYAAGSRGSGEPIVLIHGFPTSSHLWLDVVAKLPDGHRVIVLDLLGFGRSDAPLSGDYTITGHGNRTLKLLDALQINRACLVGHGTGGAIAQWVALNAPDRVSRVGLIGSATTEGWFAVPHRFGQRFRAVMLHAPSWAWVPFVRGAIAGAYSDPERGYRSAELYLMPFVDGGGVRVLRRHFAQLGNGEIQAIAARAAEITTLTIATRRSPWRFMPEEAPSEVAATIAELLAPGAGS